MALTQPPIPFKFIQQLLAKAIVKRARTFSVQEVYAQSAKMHSWVAYIISILEADYEIRVAVRARAIELMDESVFQRQLMSILTIYEILPPIQKRGVIDAFKGFSSAATQAPKLVALESGHQPGHQPPHYEP